MVSVSPPFLHLVQQNNEFQGKFVNVNSAGSALREIYHRIRYAALRGLKFAYPPLENVGGGYIQVIFVFCAVKQLLENT